MTTSPVIASPAIAIASGATGARSGWRPRVVRLLGALLIVSAVVAAAAEVRTVDLAPVLRRLDWTFAGLAAGSIALSLVAASYNLLAFTPLRLRLAPTVAMQLAVSGLRTVAPSAVTTPVIATRYLTRSGATTSDAIATVAVAQTVHLVMTTVLVTGVGLASGSAALGTALAPGRLGLIAAVAGTLVAAAVFLSLRDPRARRLLARGRASLRAVGEHVRARPVKALVGVLASAALTVTHVMAFAFCAWAVGAHPSYLALTVVYLAAASAGSLSPTPGGIGAVEAAMVAGLVAAGVDLPAATAATVLSRLASVWLFAIPGWIAAWAMRRHGLL